MESMTIKPGNENTCQDLRGTLCASPGACPAGHRYLFVVGHAHCGSTLLGRMLNMHPDVFCPGELLRMGDALREQYPCSCDAYLDRCAFWNRRLPLVPAAAQQRYKKMRLRDYDRLLEAEKCEVLVDTSKSRIFRTRRTLCRSPQSRLLFMVRDLRGILASMMRRGNDFDRVTRNTLKWLRRFQRMEQAMEGRALRLYYEDLIARPEDCLRKICRFIGIEFQADMLRPSQGDHHFIHASISPYLKGCDVLRADERWRRELSPPQQQKIEEIMAGRAFLRDRYLAG